MDFEAKLELPDEWGPRANCPICRVKGLRVLHIHGTPDLMVCDHCSTNFIVENGGSHIKITNLPPMLQSHANLKDRWMTFNEVNDYINKFIGRNQTSVESAAAIKPTVQISKNSVFKEDEEISDDDILFDDVQEFQEKIPQEVKRKVLDLYRLGNSPERIKDILRQTDNLDPHLVDVAINEVEEIDKKKRKRQTRNLWIVGIITLVCFLSFVGVLIAWSFIRRNAGSIEIVPNTLIPVHLGFIVRFL